MNHILIKYSREIKKPTRDCISYTETIFLNLMIKAFLICGVFMQQNTKDEVVTRNCNHNRPLQKTKTKKFENFSSKLNINQKE